MEFFRTGEFFSVACAVLWSAATVLFRKSGERVPPVALNLFKDAVALVLFLVTLPLVGVSLFPAEASASDWILLLVSGAIGIGIADTIFFGALNRLGAGRLAIVNALYSPLVVLVAVFYPGEPMGPQALLAMGLMVAAILVGTWEGGVRGGTPAERRQAARGVALGAVAMLLMAVAIVAVKPILDASDPWWATTVRLLGGLAFLVIHGLTPAQRPGVLAAFRPGRSWRVTVPAAVVGSYLAMIVWIAGMKYTYASTAAILNQTSTLFTPLLAAAFLGEHLTPRRLLGVGLALAGAASVVL